MFPQHLTNMLFTHTSLSNEEQRNWSMTKRDYLVKTYRIFDIAAALATLIVVFIFINLKELPAELAEVLAIRITVKNLLLTIAFSLLWQAIFKLFRLYDLAAIRSYSDEAKRILKACLLTSSLMPLFSLASGSNIFSYRAAVYFCGAAIVSTLITRHIVHALTPEWAPLGHRTRRVLIVGSGPRALRLYRSIVGRSKSISKIVGFVDTRSTQNMDQVIATQLLGNLDQLEELLTSHVVDEVLIALPIKSCYDQIQQVIETCERIGIECKYLSDIFQVSQAKTRIEYSNYAPLIAIKMVSDDYRLLVKRAFDVGGALVALILLFPVMLLTALAIKVTSQGPVMFVQERYGLSKRRFRMFKFRTMVQNAEKLQAQLEHRNEAQGPVFKIKDDPRVTPLGKFLRKTSIDELPQLLNVLRGDMSLVGPRPLPERDVTRFSESSLLRRFSVKPGLTCLWQVNGRSNTDFGNWIKQDLQYIDQWSLGLDFTILLKTVPAVIKGRGAV